MDNYFPKVSGVDISKLKINDEGKYSVTKPYVSQLIVKYILSKIRSTNIRIVDATGNVGGDTIGFALNKNISFVHTTEMMKENYDILKHNIGIYKLINKVKIENEDFTKFLNGLEANYCDLVYMDPPWGGQNYKYKEKMSLYLSNINVGELVKKIKERNISKYVVLKIPFNFNITAFQNMSNIEEISVYNVPTTSFYILFLRL